MTTAPDRNPATGRLKPPVLRKPERDKCGAGVTPCGAPARFYPAGWLCSDHAPGTKTA